MKSRGFLHLQAKSNNNDNSNNNNNNNNIKNIDNNIFRIFNFKLTQTQIELQI